MKLQWFLTGFACAFFPWLAFVMWYYSRAKKRVNSIRQAIARYQEDQSVVGDACKEVFKP